MTRLVFVDDVEVLDPRCEDCVYTEDGPLMLGPVKCYLCIGYMSDHYKHIVGRTHPACSHFAPITRSRRRHTEAACQS